MDIAALAPSESAACIMTTIAALGIGCGIPALANGILQNAHEAYRRWFHETLEEYCAFFRDHRREPRKDARGREKTLWSWARELPRLASDGMLSKHELLSLAQAEAPAPFAITPALLQKAPSEEEIARDFSVKPSALLVASSGGAMGAASAAACLGRSPDFTVACFVAFAASCWLLALVDWRSRTIPTVCTMLVVATGMAWHTLLGWSDAIASVLIACISLCALQALNRLSELRRGSPGIGGGDVRTFPAVLGVLGPIGSESGLLATAIALGAYLAVRAASGTFSLTEKLPFGPFIAIAGISGALSTMTIAS